jgi:hypothetical protein
VKESPLPQHGDVALFSMEKPFYRAMNPAGFGAGGIVVRLASGVLP